MRLILQVDENVAVTRAQTLNCHRLIVLVKAHMNDLGMTQVEFYRNSTDLVCKLMGTIVLQMEG